MLQQMCRKFLLLTARLDWYIHDQSGALHFLRRLIGTVKPRSAFFAARGRSCWRLLSCPSPVFGTKSALLAGSDAPQRRRP